MKKRREEKKGQGKEKKKKRRGRGTNLLHAPLSNLRQARVRRLVLDHPQPLKQLPMVSVLLPHFLVVVHAGDAHHSHQDLAVVLADPFELGLAAAGVQGPVAAGPTGPLCRLVHELARDGGDYLGHLLEEDPVLGGDVVVALCLDGFLLLAEREVLHLESKSWEDRRKTEGRQKEDRRKTEERGKGESK